MQRDGSCTPKGTNQADDLDKDVKIVLKELDISIDHVWGRLHQENIKTGRELFILDKEDLREIGFKMAERCRILHLAKEYAEAFPAPYNRRDSCQSDSPTRVDGGLETGFFPCSPSRSSWGPLHLNRSQTTRSQSISKGISADDLEYDDEDHLDELEEQEDLWSNCVYDRHDEFRKQDDEASEWLQNFYDITSQRIGEIFKQVVDERREDDNRDCGLLNKDEMTNALKHLGLDGLNETGVDNIFKKVCSKSDSQGINKKGLESICTRLKLTPLLRKDRESGGDSPGYRSTESDWPKADVRLTCIDYNHVVSPQFVLKQSNTWKEREKYFFGHRVKVKDQQDPLVRWVHLHVGTNQYSRNGTISGTGLHWLLALAMKYQLHPLHVEDVIEQSPTRFDHPSAHYFLPIEHLVLIEDQRIDSTTPPPVRVIGRHTTISCSGPLDNDTVITISQPDKSFSKDWPTDFKDTSSTELGVKEDKWVTKLKARLGVEDSDKKPAAERRRSRVQEKRADFLMYSIVDLCSDDLVVVTAAFSARLKHLEEEFRTRAYEKVASRSWDPKDLELSRINLQLNVVSRRLRGMMRLVRKWKDDRDLSSDLPGYLQDILDHLEEAIEDTTHLTSKCATLIQDYERAIDQVQEKRMNLTLFVLAVATFMFCPLQFMAGVYGMNFVDADGTPTIPELLVPRGYAYFWIGTITWLTLSGSAALWGYNRTIGSKSMDTDYSKQAISRGVDNRVLTSDSPRSGRSSPLLQTSPRGSMPPVWGSTKSTEEAREPLIRVSTKDAEPREPLLRVSTKNADAREPLLRVSTKNADAREPLLKVA